MTEHPKSLYRPVHAGPLTIPGNLFAAPMAGYTDRACREMALSGGADLAWTEMISSEALVRGSNRTEDMLIRGEGESFLAVQLFGSDPDVLGRAAAVCRESGADLLDLNAGCPVPKVVGKGAGAALGRDAGRLKAATAALASCGLPVSVKIRSGWDESEVTWKESAMAAVEGGSVMLGFHPRSRARGYSGRSDWNLIRELVSLVDVPVIGSGDLYSPEDAENMLMETDCAGVMFARGGVGNPEIYASTRRLLENGSTGDQASETIPDRRLELALKHLDRAAAVFGTERAGREMKKHLAGYVRGRNAAAEFRKKLMSAETFDDLRHRLIAEIGTGPSRTGRNGDQASSR